MAYPPGLLGVNQLTTQVVKVLWAAIRSNDLSGLQQGDIQDVAVGMRHSDKRRVTKVQTCKHRKEREVLISEDMLCRRKSFPLDQASLSLVDHR